MCTTMFLGVILMFLSLGCQKKTEIPERLWYTKSAKSWHEALPLGNGRLGVMIFGSVAEEHLQLNEESLWAGVPEDPFPENIKKHYAEFQRLNLEGQYPRAFDYAMAHLAVSPTAFRSYEPLGDLYLYFGHNNPKNYKRSLNLEKGINTVEYEINGDKFVRESFVSSKYNAVFYHFTSVDKEEVECYIRFERERDIRKYVNADNIICVDGQIFDDPEGDDDNQEGSGEGGYHMKFSAHVGVKVEDGNIIAKGDSLVVSGTNDFTVIVSSVTDYNPDLMNFDRTIDSEKESLKIMETALNTPYQQIKEEHIHDFSSVYNRVKFHLGENPKDTIPTDKRIKNVQKGGNDNYLTQLLFQYGRYLLMSSSGFRAVLPANLQGIWNADMWAPWESDYHLNINLQMNYWPADVCNLSETLKPLSNFMVRLTEKGKTTAKKMIGSEGWIAHYSTNVFGRTIASGSTKSSQVNNGYCFPLAGAWMSLTLWRHYQFTQDQEYLKDTVYPVISGAVEFILDFLKENSKGELVTVPSYSPENFYIDPVSGKRLRNTMAATIDIEIIRDIFDACLSAEKILSKDKLTKRIHEVLVKLPSIKIGADSTIQEWYEDYEEIEPGHRHISHLYALYPSNQITKATPELFKAARTTIEKRLSGGGGQTGWSRAWIVNFYARLFDGNECNKHINGLLSGQVSSNLFDLHPPHVFQIDGNLGVTAGIAEMLLQSHENKTIRLLPALPKDWKDGEIKGLCARGNFIIDIDWKDGKMETVWIYSPKGGKCRLRYQGKEKEFSMKAGEQLKWANF
ncbi:glycoside hydrolase family 95 protein [Mariniphaga sediminis]|nr:glycoside hydrolase family 95 protein [Mariniphaga sediminis]